MRKPYLVAAALFAILWLVCFLLLPVKAYSDEQEVVYMYRPALTPAQVIWLAHLMQCESTINAKALNPKDRDGTASIGILQFKQQTFDYYNKEYGLGGDIEDGVTQVAIVTRWIETPGTVDFAWQFPDCVKKHGLPPY